MHNGFLISAAAILGSVGFSHSRWRAALMSKNIVHFYSFMRGQSLAHGEGTLVRIEMLTESYS